MKKQISLVIIDNLPSFCRSDFKWKAVSPDKIYIVVENATKVDEVMSIDGFNGIADLLLQLGQRLSIVSLSSVNALIFNLGGSFGRDCFIFFFNLMVTAVRVFLTCR